MACKREQGKGCANGRGCSEEDHSTAIDTVKEIMAFGRVLKKCSALDQLCIHAGKQPAFEQQLRKMMCPACNPRKNLRTLIVLEMGVINPALKAAGLKF